jgi:hypothetical protein
MRPAEAFLDENNLHPVVQTSSKKSHGNCPPETAHLYFSNNFRAISFAISFEDPLPVSNFPTSVSLLIYFFPSNERLKFLKKQLNFTYTQQSELCTYLTFYFDSNAPDYQKPPNTPTFLTCNYNNY